MISLDYAAFLKRCDDIRKKISAMKAPLIVNHYDADGLSSCGLVARALRKMGKEFRIKTVRKLDAKLISELSKEPEIIFTDLGGGQIKEIEAKLAKNQVVIIDHHQTSESKILQVNPELFGFDGGGELSGAGTAWFVFRDPELVDLGIVGAVGDMQFPLKGLNRKMLEEGIKAGVVECSMDLTIFGRVSRALAWFLQYSTEPYLPGLTGKTRNCALLFKELGINVKDGERWRHYYELGLDEKKAIVSAIAAYLYHRDAEPETIRSLVGENYSFPSAPAGSELSDANEFSTVLNACGRHEKPEVGIGVCLGDEKAIEAARELLLLHRRQLREGITYASEATEDFGPFYFLDGRGVIEDGIIGVVAGMLYGGGIKRDKPIIAISDYFEEEGKAKASGRGTRDLIKRGLNLNQVMKAATSGIGIGGGHNIAAGAHFELGKINEFLLGAGAEIKKQSSTTGN